VATRVLIVDDHDEFRAVARDLLTLRGYAVVGEAACVESALTQAARLRPHAVLLDVQLRDGNGFDVARELRDTCPEAAVLIVSACDYGACEDLLRSVGAAGFLLKPRLVETDLTAFWPPAED
jgi:DNA-binding NarL/FixJ family response regulator